MHDYGSAWLTTLYIVAFLGGIVAGLLQWVKHGKR